jgi:hypothetical protein
LLFEQHAYDSPAVDDWIDHHGGDIDTIRAFGPIAEMRGQFVRFTKSQIYQYRFTPDVNGSYRAVVMPVMERGQMVDIVAFRQDALRKKLDVWAAVTGAGRFLGYDAIYDKSRTEPLEICESWWHWLRTGGKGVMALRVDAVPELRHAGDVLVDSPAIAFRLLYEAYLFPLNVDPNSEVYKTAKRVGRERIFTDYNELRRAAA